MALPSLVILNGAEVQMYCRKCRYDLRGSAELRCPECATPFDPGDSHTYLSELTADAQDRGQLSVFRIVRVLAYLHIPLVLLAYWMCGYGAYAYVFNTWDIDDPRMLMPAAGILGLYPGIVLSVVIVMFRKRMAVLFQISA
jgi:hypothetical protein